jgi:hypothetical protein
MCFESASAWPSFIRTAVLSLRKPCSEEEEWRCQFDQQLVKHHRENSSSWGHSVHLPLNHVPEGMGLFV